jgi:glycosyltransferase involved in cell wall biosynthesis
MPFEARKPRIVILEPFGNAVHGHHYTALNEIIRRIHPVRPVVVVNNEWAEPSLLHDVRALRLFHKRPHKGLRRTWEKARVRMYKAGKILSAGPGSARVGMDAEATWTRFAPAQWPELRTVCEQAHVCDADHVVLPTAEPDLLNELLLYVGKRQTAARIHARFLSKSYRRGLFDLDELLGRLRRDGQGLHLYFEMPAMKRYIEGRHGIRSDLFPYLLCMPEKRGHRRKLDGRVVFGFLGGVRDHKGFERLLPIIQRVCADPSYDRKRVRFLTQLDGKTSRAKQEIAVLKAGTARLNVDIRFHEGTASAEQYVDLFDSVDCLLLPYRAKQYHLSGSGLLHEALVHGKPFICSANLSFSDYARAGNALEPEDDAAFASAILQIVDDPTPFFEAARRCACAFGAELADNVLVRRLLQPTR